MSEILKKSLFTLGFILGGLLAYKVSQTGLINNTVNPTTNQELAEVSVMVTRMDGRSGGSGVILHSDSTGSEVLTNGHVCGVVKNGGKLITASKVAIVSSYKLSRYHDLCLISTKENLGVSTKVAKSPPQPEDDAIVSGHPNLFPTIITRGHFTEHVTIPVMTGIRPCTKEEEEGDLSLVCMFLGGIPVVKIYDSQIVSSTIMAGSSGSPVFNSSGQIAGLIFAGSGDLSYGFIVPQQYVRYFVEVESEKSEVLLPNMELSVEDLMGTSTKEKIQEFLTHCRKNEVNDEVRKYCNTLNRSVIQ